VSMTPTTETTVGIGGAAESTDMVLNIGPQHPSTHGVLRLRLVLDGERIMSAEPVIGYMHRGAEKLFEARDYRQIIMLANRHDWLSAFSNELGVVLAVERMLGMEVPTRAVWTRTLLAELNRVLNHLMFLGSYPAELAGTFDAFMEREAIQTVLEEASGGRMHYMFNRVGGLKEEVPEGWTGRARDAVEPPGWEVLLEPADAVEHVVHPPAGGFLHDRLQLLALTERVEHRGDGAQFDRIGPQEHQMVEHQIGRASCRERV